MKYTKAKPTKKSPLGKPKSASKGGKIPKTQPRSLGCGTHQLPKNAPHVV
jgi:hypothetical protein